ncbi:hypothetical protein ACFW1M_33745 [Streptomyces inhibens]|uniref:hypothetical protein n=1 Tax=Streptomyces inhibens TaxID=2293571 RepID=UPI00367BBF9E
MEFPTDEQAEAYGRFAEEPTRPELERFFFLDDADRDQYRDVLRHDACAMYDLPGEIVACAADVALTAPRGGAAL